MQTTMNMDPKMRASAAFERMQEGAALFGLVQTVAMLAQATPQQADYLSEQLQNMPQEPSVWKLAFQDARELFGRLEQIAQADTTGKLNSEPALEPWQALEQWLACIEAHQQLIRRQAPKEELALNSARWRLLDDLLANEDNLQLAVDWYLKPR